MVLTTSPCVRAMHGRYLVHRGKCDGAEVAAWEDATLAAYRQTQRQPAILRRVRALELFAQTAIIAAQGDDLLLGSQRFLELGGPRRPEVRQELGRLDWSMDIGHIIHDYRGLLSEGIGGRIGRIRQRQDAAAGDAKLTLECFARAVRAFEVFIRRHADHAARLAASSSSPLSPDWLGLASDLEAIASAPAASLRQAIQLVWLAQIFLHAENPASAISFGRLDQILWPFASADLAAGRIDHDGLAELVAAFCLRCCEGEESQNLALGGVDSEGRDATNPLSLLFTEVVGELRLAQPSLSIRWHADADPRLLAAGCALAATGLGQPAFLNDQAVIPAMQAVGIPVDRARDYGIVGCYEASPQGDCYANTVGCGFSLTGILVRYIASASAVDSASLREGFLQAVAAEYQALLKNHSQPFWNRRRDCAPSPFGSALLGGCVESGRHMADGGARFNLFGVNAHGLGSTVDSLWAIEQAVFRRRDLTLGELATAVAQDFPDEALRQRLRALPGRYGTDHPDTNELSAWLSERVARLVLDSRMEGGVRPCPGFFRWMAEVTDHGYASPDGRRRAEHLSYGAGPSSSTAAAPTAVLSSASHVAHRLCACGNPLSLNLPAADLRGEAGLERLSALVTGYFRAGGYHLHVNTVGAAEMRKAQEAPDEHRDLIVRISGLSARFTTLGRDLQAVLIDRAEKGL